MVDPTSYLTESERDMFYYKTFMDLTDITDYVNVFNLNSSPIIKFIHSLTNFDASGITEPSLDLAKNQFRPMRKGISNMIRLHATGAIAMPIEIRLHILASSRDIIHS